MHLDHRTPSPTPCYLDGSNTAARRARSACSTRGFIFGDGVYEVVPVYDGQPFCFEEHMARLDRSLAESADLTTRLSLAQWREIAMRLVDAARRPAPHGRVLPGDARRGAARPRDAAAAWRPRCS